jgi:hypothetical protein
LLAKNGPVEFFPPLSETKEIIIRCLQEIVASTQNFPRIEKELFPEMKDCDMQLLCVRSVVVVVGKKSKYKIVG